MNDEQIREIEKIEELIRDYDSGHYISVKPEIWLERCRNFITALRASNEAVEKLAARYATTSRCPPPKFVCQFYIDAGLEDCLKCWKKWAHDETT